MFEIILADFQRTVHEYGAGCKVGLDLVIRDCNTFYYRQTHWPDHKLSAMTT
jgi:hypothetical protein